jgi:Acyl-coenzyme A synthetases/AMP-(fatty) acid ligases
LDYVKNRWTSSIQRALDLSTGAIEEVLSEHKSVAECAVIGIADKLKGQVPNWFY